MPHKYNNPFDKEKEAEIEFPKSCSKCQKELLDDYDKAFLGISRVYNDTRDPGSIPHGNNIPTKETGVHGQLEFPGEDNLNDNVTYGTPQVEYSDEDINYKC